MKAICLPFPGISENDTAEVIVKSLQGKAEWIYRIVNFQINAVRTVEDRINALREKINTYDAQWELIQVLDTDEEQTHVHVLYRKKKEE